VPAVIPPVAEAVSPAIYAAGPSGFTAAGLAFHTAVVLPALVTAGCSVLDPWDPTAGPAAAFAGLGTQASEEDLARGIRAITAHNVDLIDAADGVLAVLDGTDVDSGTAAEIGYAAARGLPIIGIRLDLRRTGDPGAIVNAQVEHFCELTGGSVLACPPGDLADPGGFVRDAVERLVALIGWWR
jgi:nucleoside 2-deoxyribosyltransferase